MQGAEKILPVKPLKFWGDYQTGQLRHVYIERYNHMVRHEWLDRHIIETIEEAQNFATQLLWTYTNDRPNMSIGGVTPAQKLKMAA